MRRNIVFIGACWYGNIGDDTYTKVWKRYLAREATLIFINSDYTNRSRAALKKADLIVIGGGGMIYDSNGHFEAMKRYMDYAIKNQTPYGFASCGVQVRRNKDKTGWDYSRFTKRWLPYLEKAEFISLRSQKSCDYLNNKLKRNDVQYFPDLCYLYREPVLKLRSYNAKQYITIIPCASCKIQNKEVRNKLKWAMKKWPDKKVIAMNMGSPLSDDRVKAVKKVFPEVKEIPSQHLTPARALEIIHKSEYVISGRYHGMIFSRVCDTPFYTAKGAQYKIEVEDRKSNMEEAIGHVNVIKNYLKNE